MADTNNEATSPAPAALVIHGIPVGVPVPVDAELDPDSDNPVNNKAVSEKFENHQDQIDDAYKELHLSDWENVTNQCTIASGVSMPALIVFDNGHRYRIQLTVSSGSSTPHAILTLPKKPIERLVCPVVGDNGGGQITGAVGHIFAINTNVLQMSSTNNVPSYFSALIDVYHD